MNGFDNDDNEIQDQYKGFNRFTSEIQDDVISDIFEEKVINLLGSACEYSTYEFKSFILLNFEDMRMTSLIKVKQICFQFKI